MPLMISLVDIPAEGLPIECEVPSAEIDLSTDDGKILGSLNCTGHIFSTDENFASFQGALSGKVMRECVRCLMSFEEDISLPWDAEFKQFNQAVAVPGPSKKMKKGSRRPDSVIDDEIEIDTYPIMDEQIDLLPALREHLILATPVQPLCHESCTGLCQVCGANLNEGICGCCSPVTVSSALGADVDPMLRQKAAIHSSRPV